MRRTEKKLERIVQEEINLEIKFKDHKESKLHKSKLKDLYKELKESKIKVPQSRQSFIVE